MKRKNKLILSLWIVSHLVVLSIFATASYSPPSYNDDDTYITGDYIQVDEIRTPVSPGTTVSVAAYNSANYYHANYQCDGSSDETEINSAITYCSNLGGGTVLLLDGVFNCDGRIELLSDVTLSGLGMYVTKIEFESGADVGSGSTGYHIGGSTKNRVVVEDLELDLSNISGAADKRGIFFFYTEDTVIRNCYVHNITNAGELIGFAHGKNNTIDSCVGHDSDDYGFAIGHEDNSSIINCRFSADGASIAQPMAITDAGGLYWSYNCKMIGNHILGNGEGCAVNIRKAVDCICSNNIIMGSFYEGIRTEGVKYLLIDSNIIDLNDNGTYGIELKDRADLGQSYPSTNVTISNNIIRNLKTVDAPIGIYGPNRNSSDISVIGNKFCNMRSPNNGAACSLSANNTLVANNQIRNVYNGMAFVNGYGNITVTGNHISEFVSYAIYCANKFDVAITDNIFYGGSTVITATNCNTIMIRDNIIKGCTTSTSTAGSSNTNIGDNLE